METNVTKSQRATDDLLLVQRVMQRNDAAAYEILMKRYKESVFYTILKMVGKREDAEDLTLEVFAKAFQGIDKYTESYAFSTWLFRIASNHVVDFLRKRKLDVKSLDIKQENEEGDVLEVNIADDTLDPEQTMIKQQRVELMQKATSRLSPKYREMIQLRYYDELSYDEIAEKLDIPEGTVKAQLNRARAMLQTIMGTLKGTY